MKRLPFLSLLLLLALTVPSGAQMDDSDSQTPAPPGSTVITSDELHSDEANHTSVFTGKVVVTGNQFRMTCQEMTVYFTKDNKVDKIVAVGDVIITQPDRVTHCGHAEYLREEDKFVLTDRPVILDHKNKVTGPQINIYRTGQKMEVIGRSTVTMGNDVMGSSATPAPANTPK